MVCVLTSFCYSSSATQHLIIERLLNLLTCKCTKNCSDCRELVLNGRNANGHSLSGRLYCTFIHIPRPLVAQLYMVSMVR